MKVSISDGILHKYEKEGSKLRKFGKYGSWTIQLDWLANVTDIIYETSKYIYKITKNKVIDVGYKKIFNGEPKYVVGIEHWEKLKK